MEKAREIQRRRDNSSSNVRKICNLQFACFFQTFIFRNDHKCSLSCECCCQIKSKQLNKIINKHTGSKKFEKVYKHCSRAKFRLVYSNKPIEKPDKMKSAGREKSQILRSDSVRHRMKDPAWPQECATVCYNMAGE